MIRRVKLYARLKQPENKYPRVPVDFDRNGRPVPVKGEITNYYIRIAGKFIDAGENLTSAVSRMRTEQDNLRDGVPRNEVFARPVAKPENPSGRIRLVDAVAEYKSELRTLDKSKATKRAYNNTLDSFVESYRKTFIDEIERKDILTYIDWMRENLDVRVAGSQNRTLRNRLVYLGTFLGKHGIQLKKSGSQQAKDDDGLLFRSDIPKNMKQKPKKFDQSTIAALLEKANDDETDYLEFLLWSGFRDEEVQYLLFSDFNFRNSTVMVQAKPRYGWKPKDWEEREITLPSPVMQRMKERMGRMRMYEDGMRKAGENDLVFTSSVGRPDAHLIDMLHAVAKKAGMNLRGKRAGHAFRKTAGSRVAKAEGLPAAMEFLGHSDIKTTALYLAADASAQTKKRQSADEMYEHYQNGAND
jgi:integrase/recombinase XerD